MIKNIQIDSEPVLGNMWANVNPTYSYNKTHTHPNSMWSGVYYIKVPGMDQVGQKQQI